MKQTAEYHVMCVCVCVLRKCCVLIDINHHFSFDFYLKEKQKLVVNVELNRFKPNQIHAANENRSIGKIRL